jgi:transcriptional regulator of acetoin/glycerol metabolism
MNLAIALTDSRARVIQRVDVSPAVGRLLDRIYFAPGFDYAEGTMGTNGVGTVLEAGQPISIVGPEHFTENLQPFACTGAPVIDPLTGRLEGILDVSTLSQSWSPLMHTLVKSAAKDIARNLLMDRSQAQQALFDTYLRTDARSTKHAVFAFTESIFIANAAAQALFNPGEQQAIRQHSTFIMGRRDRVSDTVTLASGLLVQVRGTRIVAGGDTAGLVVIAELLTNRLSEGLAASPSAGSGFHERVLPQVAVANAQTRLLVSDLRRGREPIAGGTSPAWIRACDAVREALGSKTPTIVLGETGTGKFTLVTELFHADHPGGRSIAVDARQLDNGGDSDIHALIDRCREETLFVVRNIDQAGTEAVEHLDQFFASVAASSAPVSFAATLSDSSLDSDLPFHTLLSHFHAAVTIPPLRCRTEDLGHVVAGIVREVAPSRRVRLSPEAERTIARYSWPRNVLQLREALAHALRMRPVGEIQQRDLPSYCYTNSRKSLTPLETAERDAIIAALKEHEGNRVAAAQHVGMSRSSLYRKIKAYGITA